MITKATLERTLPGLLRPLVRLCIRYAVKIGEFEAMIKKLFLEEAKEHLIKSGEQISASRISVMTGMQRLAISQLENDTSAFKPRAGQSLVMKVINAWQTKKAFVTKQGKPRVISCEGKESEFCKLVHAVSQALNPYTVLYELERAKLVQRTSRGLSLLAKSFVSRHDIEQTLRYLASDIGDMTESVEKNVRVDTTLLNHHLTTEYDSIPAGKVDEIKQLLLEEGEKFHARMRQLIGSFDSDENNTHYAGATVRVALCSFSNCREIEKEVD